MGPDLGRKRRSLTDHPARFARPIGLLRNIIPTRGEDKKKDVEVIMKEYMFGGIQLFYSRALYLHRERGGWKRMEVGLGLEVTEKRI